jgi:hypothetical protein
LLGRTRFTLLLRGCSIAGMHAGVPEGTVPRMFRLKVEDRTLLLRYWGTSEMNPTWSVKAHLKETSDGVLLTGRVRYLFDRLMFGMLAVFTAIFLTVTAVLVIGQGPASHEYVGPLIGASVPGGLLLLHVGTFRSGMARREDRAKKILRGAYESR